MLATLDAESCHTCVTSPPYWGLRDYGHADQLGLEATPEEYIARLVEVFRGVRRALRPDGTLWLNIGDSYAQSASSSRQNRPGHGFSPLSPRGRMFPPPDGLKPKDLVGIPWMFAFALRADGWYLRSDIIWHKPNPMPESVRDRPTKAHEYVFLLSKCPRYYFDQDAVREPVKPTSGIINGAPLMGAHRMTEGGRRTERREYDVTKGANIRSVWTIATQPFPGAHFAVMPPALVEPCIKAGAPLDGLVLDPFAGAGTVGMVARRLQRRFVGIELNPTFADMAERRIEGDAPLFNRREKPC